jgi:diketogulonate reductase-like aldo/keto reductase
MDIPTLELRDGSRMPVLGLGTWKLSGREGAEAIGKALEMGYNHIDTADRYGNHDAVARAIRGHDRSGLFITTKVWKDQLRRGDVVRACGRFLRELGTGYIDLLLVHWPNPEVPIGGTMEAMQELREKGSVRSIGVSNFTEGLLEEALDTGAEVSVNQVEFHPHLHQKGLLGFCRKRGVAVTAYSPLARGEVLKDGTIRSIAAKHGKTPAQVALRWVMQKGAIAIPKASSGEHIRQNMGALGWELDAGDVRAIDGLNRDRRMVDYFFPFSGG